jgi:nucleoside-diphosphate-sugar epimerase
MLYTLVTGASGLVGGCLVNRLVRDGQRVRVLIRPESDYLQPDSGAVEVVRSDPFRADVLERALAGCATVFHCAGAVNARSPFETDDHQQLYRRGILDHTTALLQQAERAGVTRFVYLSSVAVYSNQATSPISEDAVCAPATAYGHFKLLAERELQRIRGLAVTIVRPCIIYGPGDRHFVPTMKALGALPVIPLPEGGRRKIDLVHVEDVVSLMVSAAAATAAEGRVYNAASSHAVSLRAIVDLVRSAQNTATPVAIPVPGRLAAGASVLARWYLKRYAPNLMFAASPESVNYFRRDIYFDVSRAARELDYRPRFRVEEALLRSLQRARYREDAN